MADLNIQLALDALATAVEAVTPRVMAAFGFKRHRGAVALEDADNPLRMFEWRDSGDFGLCSAPQDPQGPVSDGATIWHYVDLELAVAYPKILVVPGDDNARGISGLALADAVDLNKKLSFGNPLSALNFSFYYLELRGRRRADKIRSLIYRLRWAEDYP